MSIKTQKKVSRNSIAINKELSDLLKVEPLQPGEKAVYRLVNAGKLDAKKRPMYAAGYYLHETATGGPKIQLNVLRPKLKGQGGITGTLTHEQTHARQFDPKLGREEKPFADLMETEKKYQEQVFKKQDQGELDALLRGEDVPAPLTFQDFYTRYNPHEAMARGVAKSPKSFEEAYQEEMGYFMDVLSEHRSLRGEMEYMINWEKTLGEKRRGE